ncbi:MAG: DUF5011 domain-containing protein, partial [Clostridia bacterium]|nr:DUF5011 domain-containing protein [Clostridia bacterium]
ISFESEQITVPLDATADDMLAGVSAFDEKDGDLSDKVIVESISRFVEKGVSVVRYAVCDGDNHVTAATRRIEYEDYTSPRFTITSSLVFPTGQAINIHGIIGAEDKIDEDISDEVIITANEYTVQSNGVYTVNAKVTNSKGDMISRSFPVYIEERSLAAPEIKLENYIVYCAVGEKITPADNVVTVFAADGTDLKGSLEIDTNLDTGKAGTYEVHYRAKDSLGRTGHAVAFVIVED